METGWLDQVYYDENGPDQEYWISNYIDSFLLILLGGIPWQVPNVYLNLIFQCKGFSDISAFRHT